MKAHETVKYAVNVNQFTHLNDFEAMLEFVKQAEKEGYDKVRFIDHIVGVDVSKHPEMPYTPYTHHSNFYEVFTLLAYLCHLTSRVKLCTGVLGLPQRQTALVAKQAAQIDVLSGGRMLLGVGLGYNAVEFAALETEMKIRARRFEEQIDVLRMLWSGEVVEFKGDFHDLQHVNINPPPIQKSIPIWIGAGRTENPVPPDNVLARIGRKGDGWCPLFRIPDGAETLDAAAQEAIAKVNAAAVEAGRDPKSIDLELGLFPDGKSREQLQAEIAALHELGSNHIHVRFTGKTAAEQIAALKRFRDLIA
ncbi:MULTISPECIES: LLM class F420-dependent oxidoreductase [unclassified Chelatococcus]|uniref:LLM class F420-dependent oxidoreductase n=1 Tax=unclassified Chelatococcus TaxID=2638111 RepID=UPI001BCB529B|nr:MULTISPECIES: LLM class F420-dependent oxidoreductase [unclassified Chelatococcus]MBS7700253.1 LLM class F420-dependent oxidoreductase [Chelatococcus sp. YT9]MBX3558224.1 LLM class F420-dependent oxidoreductase [Chelatococcus sp.]